MARREALGKGVGALFSEQEEEKKPPERSVITNELEVVSRKSGEAESLVTTNNSEVSSRELGVSSMELGVSSEESEVVSRKSGGAESLVTTNNLEVSSRELGVTIKQKAEGRKHRNRQYSTTIKTTQITEAVDPEILEQAISEALASPRISTWSPPVMSALRYLQLTTARFSMSREVSETLEAAFKEKYPNLFEKIEEELAEKQR